MYALWFLGGAASAVLIGGVILFFHAGGRAENKNDKRVRIALENNLTGAFVWQLTKQGTELVRKHGDKFDVSFVEQNTTRFLMLMQAMMIASDPETKKAHRETIKQMLHECQACMKVDYVVKKSDNNPDEK